MNITNNNFSSIEQMAHKISEKDVRERSRQSEVNSSISFYNILNQAQNEKDSIKFSKHANLRMQDRNIDLSSGQLKRLEDGTRKAKEKGVKETVVCVDDYAFIVNVDNNTVVTAMNGEDEKVFTNIDGAVIM